jgi:hypothetical protein
MMYAVTNRTWEYIFSCAKVRWGSASHLYQSCVSGSALLDQETVEIVGPNKVLT